MANDFLSGVGARLQELLHERDKKEPNSWLETWWNECAYLAFRESNVINSNFAMPFRSFPGGPISQSRRAALVSVALLEYKSMIDDGSLKPDRQPNDQLPHTRTFSACRIPNEGCDYQKRYRPSNHIVVICNDVFWILQYRKDEFHALPLVTELESAFEAIKVTSHSRNTGSVPPIGIGTYLHRDAWLQMRSRLVELGNTENLEVIQSSAFVLCLDDCAPKTSKELMDLCLMGDIVSCSNRWYDKPVLIMIGSNGEGGLNGEHSPVDGEIISRMVDWVLDREVELDQAEDPNGDFSVLFSKKLEWKVDYELMQDLRRGVAFAINQISNVSSELLNFTKFGKAAIVKNKMSPDAFVQAAMQLAYYRLHHHFAPAYESVSTRRYLAGRTETGRSLTAELRDFILAMEDASLSVAFKRQLLGTAAKAHVAYMKEAQTGHGVDRHLLGLRLLARDNNITHAFLTDKVMSKSCHWKLSTSQVLCFVFLCVLFVCLFVFF